VVFTTGFLEPAYRRFLERRLREDFGFPGSPVEISVRTRDSSARAR
jgi:GTP-binding protein